MAKDTHLTLNLDKAVPTDKECLMPGTTTSHPLADFGDFLDKLQKGKLTYLGSIYSGDVATAASASIATPAGSCVIVYLGGTAYKVCS